MRWRATALLGLFLAAVAAGCGRTPSETGRCIGAACPCVFNTDCEDDETCVDGVCVNTEDYQRCLDDGIQPETCNGRDDDCNGLTDEDLGERSCERMADGLVCSGTERCSGMVGWICDALSPREELCDGLDDDCDGLVDEPFRSEEGAYVTDAHCGACNRNCDELISDAEETTCSVDSDGPRCIVLRCRDGLIPSQDQSRCTSLSSALCSPCTVDEDCVGPGARCLALGEGETGCGRDCGPESPFGAACPAGYLCQDSQCRPDTGTCLCGPTQLGATRSCTVEPACDGVQTCEARGGDFQWGQCDISSAREACDGIDNDCDAVVDNGFVDGEGRYFTDEHCGVCNNDCTKRWVEEIDHAVGGCDLSQGRAECAILRCTEETVGGQRFEWVDVDREQNNGCECRRQFGNQTFDPPDLTQVPRPGLVFLDENCDGVDGVIAEAVFASASASAGGDGSRARPFSTLATALAALRADASKSYILAAEGTYPETLVLEEGDQIYGGYASDFFNRDLVRFETVIRSPIAGQPGLSAEDLGRGSVVTRVSGVRIVAPDVNMSPSEGQIGQTTVAVRFVGCGTSLELRGSVVQGGRAGNGGPGAAGGRGFGRQTTQQVDGRRGADGRRIRGTCSAGTVVPGGTGGANSSCGAQGRAGGSTGCPVFNQTTVRGEQVPHRSPTSGGDGPGGFHWTFDVLSGPSCSHLTESGFPSDVQDNNGLDGSDGADGANGSDAQGCLGAFGRVVDGAWLPSVASAGAPGGSGTPGGGGGGGGGTARFFQNADDCRSHELGGTGGGGGAGGCGGLGGSGGLSGGASFAIEIVSTDGNLPAVFDNYIQRGRGGRGGAGGFGGSGGEGGRGGFGGQPTSWSGSEGGKGGDGGNGGRGGTGGGGCGGPSVGVLVSGASRAPDYGAVNDFRFPDATDLGGAGGPGAGGTNGLGRTGGSARVVSVP